jgi:very-short-patch-repair endonuclease
MHYLDRGQVLVTMNNKRDFSILRDHLWYRLDFALRCVNGQIDVEADGVAYHTDPERRASARRRDRKLQLAGWEVLRFIGQEVRESLAEYCIPEIAAMVNHLGGSRAEGTVPRTFHETTEGLVQQLSLFGDTPDLGLD